MEKVIIAIILITSVSSQFRPGTISVGVPGALFDYTFVDDGDGYTKTTKSVGTNLSSDITIQPTFSYFLQPNISVDGYIGLNRRLSNYADWGDESESTASIIGGGATYYMNNVYGGMGVAMIGWSDDEYTSEESKYLEFHGGYLHRLAQNVYLDIGFSQLSGMGKYEIEWEGESCADYGDGCEENEYSQFDFKVGIKAFFSL